MTDWRFLHAIPPHHVAIKLLSNESIKLDGKLDDAAWNAPDVVWTSTPFVDITRHNTSQLNSVPSNFQARAKIRWDDNFLYIGAELNEPFIVANITGHNGKDPPYHDNDFEVFVDPSGSTHYYKEYEMSARNATCDVLWGVPDGEGLTCLKAPIAAAPIAPLCVNTSFPGYYGNWTMVANSSSNNGGGLVAATSYDPSHYGKYVYPHAVWTAEIAFPLHSTSSHGGLLDGASPNSLAKEHDPSAAAAASQQQQRIYWYFDLARAEHPRRYSQPSMNSSTVTCPLGCSPQLTSWRADLSSPTPDECKDAKAKWPTLLGIHPWNCYWEWVYANVGPQNNYMHRPLYWASLQFASRDDGLGVKACGPIEWPGRYLMRSVLIAQRDHKQRTKTYFTSEAELTAACKLAAGCDVDDVAYALRTKSTFPNGIQLAVEANATKLRPDCTARPCFRASVVVRVPPSGSFEYTTRIDSNSKLVTEWPSGQRPCLF